MKTEKEIRTKLENIAADYAAKSGLAALSEAWGWKLALEWVLGE